MPSWAAPEKHTTPTGQKGAIDEADTFKGRFEEMGKQKEQKYTQAFRLIPEYRDKIDIHKICQALIMTAKDKPGKAETSTNKETG